MPFPLTPYHFGARIGVAVPAAVRTGAVGADIHAFDTAAGLPLAGILTGQQGEAGERLDPFLVDAGGPSDPDSGEIGFAAGVQPQPVGPGGTGEGGGQGLLLVLAGAAPARFPQAFAHPRIPVHKAENPLLGTPSQGGGRGPKGALVRLHRPLGESSTGSYRHTTRSGPASAARWRRAESRSSGGGTPGSQSGP